MTNDLARPPRLARVPDGADPQAAAGKAASGDNQDASRPGGRRYRRRPGGRRYRSGRPPARPMPGGLQDRPADQQPAAEPTSFPALASAPWALVRMFTVCLVSCLLAGWLHLYLIAGLGFCVGCVLATRYTRRNALLYVVISLPVIFLAAALAAQLATAAGGGTHHTVVSALVGTVLTLADVAPWLLAGTAGGLGIALFRGLPQCVRDLRADASGRTERRNAAGADSHSRDDPAN